MPLRAESSDFWSKYRTVLNADLTPDQVLLLTNLGIIRGEVDQPLVWEGDYA